MVAGRMKRYNAWSENCSVSLKWYIRSSYYCVYRHRRINGFWQTWCQPGNLRQWVPFHSIASHKHDEIGNAFTGSDVFGRASFPLQWIPGFPWCLKGSVGSYWGKLTCTWIAINSIFGYLLWASPFQPPVPSQRAERLLIGKWFLVS